MKLLLSFLLLISVAHAQDIFKDLRSYYNACGLVGKDDPRFEACNPPHMAQIMENFKQDPKNVEDMKKIARFHMTHSLQAPAKKALVKFYETKDLKQTVAGNESFVITLSPSCGGKTSLDYGQVIKDGNQKMKTIKAGLAELKKYPCSKTFMAFAVGVVDVTGNPDVWMINDKKELKQIIRSTGKTPFSE